jgi:hypothetical protein
MLNHSHYGAERIYNTVDKLAAATTAADRVLVF